MKAENRIRKIEEATGINEPCPVCEHIDDLEPRLLALAARLGVQLPQPFGPKMAFPCYYCPRVKYLEVGEFSVSERVLFERLESAFTEGWLCMPENSTIREEIGMAIERISRAKWGEHHAKVEAVCDEHLEELKQICAHLIPRRIYVCRVPGCGCEYPKTEEEWHRNVQRRLAA